MFWTIFKKRQKDDLARLVSAYRFFLKIGEQPEAERLGLEPLPDRKWKGGFGKARQHLFKDWPSPNESRLFEKIMIRRRRKTNDLDRAFIQAFNDYLHQRRLTEDELAGVMQQGKKAYYR